MVGISLASCSRAEEAWPQFFGGTWSLGPLESPQWVCVRRVNSKLNSGTHDRT
ncbi:hypothetical protein PR202_gb29298 [Eleusine coracana subsp. coracana]|uniref:Uncharacterized protein n=1 Tax=Eleusine coracana subsp. coracana TaxID=191504 RepID=A0AAV5FYR1_ELECO|nr:hypothetical protein PR202_gb29298 [Eleusine coracana subsp. coracana]